MIMSTAVENQTTVAEETIEKPNLKESINEIKKHSWLEMIKEYKSCSSDLVKIGTIANEIISEFENDPELKSKITDIEKYNLCIAGIASDINELSKVLLATKNLHKSKLGPVLKTNEDMTSFSVCLNAYMDIRSKLLNLSLLPVSTLATMLTEAKAVIDKAQTNEGKENE